MMGVLSTFVKLLARDSMETCPSCGEWKRSYEQRCPKCIDSGKR